LGPALERGIVVTHHEALSALQSLVQKPVFTTALGYISGRDLALNFDGRVEFALYLQNGTARVEEREAKNCDVEFVFQAEALRQLGQSEGTHLASFGIAVMEQILARQLKIRVRSSAWRLATGGYVPLILAAGPELMAYLAQHGISNSKKIIDLMRSLKS